MKRLFRLSLTAGGQEKGGQVGQYISFLLHLQQRKEKNHSSCHPEKAQEAKHSEEQTHFNVFISAEGRSWSHFNNELEKQDDAELLHHQRESTSHSGLLTGPAGRL